MIAAVRNRHNVLSEEELTLGKIIESCIESKQVKIKNSKKTVDCTSELNNAKT